MLYITASLHLVEMSEITLVHFILFQIELQPSDVDLERVVEDDDSTEAENQDALEEVIMQFVVLKTLLSVRPVGNFLPLYSHCLLEQYQSLDVGKYL